MSKRIAYFYDNNIGNFYYATGHPMKPHRVRMTHTLLVNYNLFDAMTVYRPARASFEALTAFHTEEYVNFLHSISTTNMKEMARDLQRFNVGEDCPIFKGLYDYCTITAGGTLCAANKINSGDFDIAINWAGGLHHAKRNEASGFCYVNDIVLGILELLKFNKRVMYIDIDVHHGDGVEEAFYTTDRVMTVSFHKYGDYFPGTGALEDIGVLRGRNYAVNVPLKEGIDDETYKSIFRPVVSRAVEVFGPSVIVLQCGADSLSGDRLGCFNLSNYGHAECVKFVRDLNIPMIVLGGGGYTIRNVSRAWAYETSVLCNVEIDKRLPFNEYYDYFGPDYTIEVKPTNMKNENTPKYLSYVTEKIFENLRNVVHVPSVQLIETPPALVEAEEEDLLWRNFVENKRDDGF